MITAVSSIITGGSVTATLLAIDDSKTMRKVLEITFAGENYRTVLSDSASDGLAKLRSEHPTIVLLDAILGDSNGYEICQKIKAEAPSVGVILLSSKQHPYDRTRGSSVGADDFIDKPFDTQVLIDKVGSLVQKLSTQTAKPAAVAAAPAPTPAVAPRPVAAPPPAAPVTRQHTTMSFGSSSGAAATPAPSAVASKASAPPARAAAPAAAAAVSAKVVETSDLESKLSGLGLTEEQVAGVLAISKDVVEQVVWEVVPVLAEALIREEIQRLTAE
jgi:DNA-binding response OmpR family regulator